MAAVCQCVSSRADRRADARAGAEQQGCYEYSSASYLGPRRVRRHPAAPRAPAPWAELGVVKLVVKLGTGSEAGCIRQLCHYYE